MIQARVMVSSPAAEIWRLEFDKKYLKVYRGSHAVISLSKPQTADVGAFEVLNALHGAARKLGFEASFDVADFTSHFVRWLNGNG